MLDRVYKRFVILVALSLFFFLKTMVGVSLGTIFSFFSFLLFFLVNFSRAFRCLVSGGAGVAADDKPVCYCTLR
ncbi:hypothetical protein PSV08DRAFT_295001 [Bipolaris maydis]|uniref:uncharacterized protein n=1 Tax=Cochliobolus heterostrophus TaxID=5016 RepID=UPI0024DBC2A5|nr:hypothetical protein J3E73DRAFT_309157 [Bipolaris maydis]KAJ6271540.1 hypothetical protein PSV08DRAFT_295001 [Bipolaris maydis]